MLGTEPLLVENEVANGELQLVFWPVINHGNPSVYASVAMECAGQQDPALAWTAHDILFENLSALYSGNLDLYLSIAEQTGGSVPVSTFAGSILFLVVAFVFNSPPERKR